MYCNIEKEYPKLYSDIFNEIDEIQVPSYIYLGFLNGDYVGFMSAYLRKKNCVYIEYAGFEESFRGYSAVVLFKQVVEFVHRDYEYIVCRIENTNVPAMKVALSTGFIPIGSIGINDILFIEWIKVKED